MENTELGLKYAAICGAVLSLVGLGAGLMKGISVGRDIFEMVLFGLTGGLGAAAIAGIIGIIGGGMIGSVVQLLRRSA